MLDPLGRPNQRIRLGHYDLLARLGRGGMADVYLAVSRGLAGFEKLSVLKVLRPYAAPDDESFKMFLDEARLSAKFSHPNVVHTQSVEQDGSYHFLVMEYLEGRTLAQLDVEHPDLPLPLRLQALADALHGLHYAHELTDHGGRSYQVVHRDVSPQNVFVTYDGQAKIVDFGVAKARDALSRTREGTFKGKVRYMAPEQLIGAPIDRRADVFSAGILLWHALTGRPLWDGLDQIAVMHRLVSLRPVPPPSSVQPDVPPALDAACAKALSCRPEDRFATARELAAVLEDFLAQHAPGTERRSLACFFDEHYAAKRERFRASLDERLRALREAPVVVPFARGSGEPVVVPFARGSDATARNELAAGERTPGSGRPLSSDDGRAAGRREATPSPHAFSPPPPEDRKSPRLRIFAPTARPAPPRSRPRPPALGLSTLPPAASGPDAPRRRSSVLPLVGASLVVAAAAAIPWWPRVWPRVQASVSQSAPLTPAASPAAALSNGAPRPGAPAASANGGGTRPDAPAASNDGVRSDAPAASNGGAQPGGSVTPNGGGAQPGAPATSGGGAARRGTPAVSTVSKGGAPRSDAPDGVAPRRRAPATEAGRRKRSP
jgi:serine/threonine protein kinase